jgi:DNA-binding MarR family transcriptional regulator
MQSLRSATDRGTASQRCAEELLACVPTVMRFIRHEMRSHRHVRLSVPQFRTIIFASLREDSSLSALAEHLGLSLPAASRMVDQLVRGGLLLRRQAAQDRRRVLLSPTPRGETVYQRAHDATRKALARRFDSISADDRLAVSRAIRILGRVFGTLAVRERDEKRES